MRRYFGRKLLIYAITFFVAGTLDWIIPRLMPGNPIQSLLSRQNVTPEAVPHLIAYYNSLFGLDRPVWEQFVNFWASLLHGDLGRSVYRGGQPVTDVIFTALPYTLALLIPAIALSWWAGNQFGAFAARRKFLDNAILPIGYILTATPYMWLAILLAWIFASQLRFLPIALGIDPKFVEPGLSLDVVIDMLRHWVLPFTSLFLVMFGGWAIGMRNMIIYELESDYSHYLEALGAPQSLVRKYAFRNAVLPQITGLALQLGTIVAGSLVTEVVFQYPGLGTLTLNSILNEDYFLLQGIFLFIITGVLVANFIVDIVYVLVDPRTRVGMGGVGV